MTSRQPARTTRRTRIRWGRVAGLLVVLAALPLFKDRYIYYFKESYKAFEFVIRAIGGMH